jgi:3-hydroxybutyrate dehydrogenase
MTLKTKNAIITGSTSGIGLAIAKRLASEGVNVQINGFGEAAAIEQERLNLEKTYGVKAIYSPANMQKPAEIAQMVRDAESTFGSVDILVNNAGIQHVAPIEDFPADKWEAILSINLSADFYAMQAAIPGMKSQGFGRIINIASAHGLVASAQKCAYVAAKHGLVGLTKAVALEVAEYDITVNAICPGWVDTPLVRAQIDARAKTNGTSIEQETKALIGEKQPNKRFTSPEQVADLLVFLAQPMSSSITGTTHSIDGGWTAW